jgi:hypothetical protein
MLLTPPLTAAADLPQALKSVGHGVIGAADVLRVLDTTAQALAAWGPFWNELPADTFLRDGGRYRRRRHSCFIVRGDSVEQVAHRSHWQPLEYNALHGGLERLFEPMDVALTQQPLWMLLLQRLAGVCSAIKGEQPWFVEAHQFRIDTTDGIGRPTPEGAHRDGVDFVVVALVDRLGVKGGETRVFDADGPSGIRFTMIEPWTLLMLDDERVVHETTPIQPLAPDGHRDSLVLTLRRGGFQGPRKS